MTTIKPINELIGMTPEQYENFILERYMRWCESKCDPKHPDDFQKFLANKSLSSWFIDEYARLESEFAKMVANTHSYLKLPQIKSLYSTITVQAYEHYPKPLIEAARKIKIINNLN